MGEISIMLQSDGILLLIDDGNELHHVERKVGEYWLIGAIDKEAYPYEVMIHVVSRKNDPNDER